MSSKKTNSFRGISANAGNLMEGDQPNPNSFLSPYEQLEAESEALVSKLLDVVSRVKFCSKNIFVIIMNYQNFILTSLEQCPNLFILDWKA